jgi:two-component system LytT family sensor kinase
MERIRILLPALFALIVLYSPASLAQKRIKGQIQFQFKDIDRNSQIESSGISSVHDTAVFDIFDYIKTNKNEQFNISKPVSPILLGVRFNPTLRSYGGGEVTSMTKSFRSYIISDSSAVTVIAMGINKANVKNYRYRVVENDSTEIVHWSKIPSLAQNFGAKVPYGFIGNFNSPGKQLLIEVVDVDNYSVREGVIFDWRSNFKPQIAQIIIATPQIIAEKEKVYTFPIKERSRPNVFNINTVGVNRGMATQFDKKTNIPLDLHFNTDSVITIGLFFKNHPSVSYSIHLIKKTGSKVDTTTLVGKYGENIFGIDSKLFNSPGKYEIIIQRDGRLPGEWPADQTLRIPFDVKPPPVTEKKVSIKQLIPYTGAALSGVAFLFFLYRRQSNIKLRRAAQEKQVLGLKLRSIRAQLNPHFMFNALTSIQNLINKNNITGANYYLSKFSRLTRQVLDSSNEELISLEDELKVLDDYLQMEQLRFNFKYEIKVDKQLNVANIDIPAMLLQPFVENAIKHGIAGLNEDGRINVVISAERKGLLLTVTDNGVGFQTEDKAGGYGIKLSEERVQLLNQIYKDQSVTLTIAAAQPGTVVTIRLSNWI